MSQVWIEVPTQIQPLRPPTLAVPCPVSQDKELLIGSLHTTLSIDLARANYNLLKCEGYLV